MQVWLLIHQVYWCVQAAALPRIQTPTCGKGHCSLWAPPQPHFFQALSFNILRVTKMRVVYTPLLVSTPFLELPKTPVTRTPTPKDANSGGVSHMSDDLTVGEASRQLGACLSTT